MATANALAITIGIKYLNGSASDQVNSFTQQISQTLQELDGSITTIPTTAGGTVVTFADLTNYGWLFIQNLDPANFITFGPTSAGAMVTFGKLLAGEAGVFRLTPGIVFRILADTASVKVRLKAWGA